MYSIGQQIFLVARCKYNSKAQPKTPQTQWTRRASSSTWESRRQVNWVWKGARFQTRSHTTFRWIGRHCNRRASFSLWLNSNQWIWIWTSKVKNLLKSPFKQVNSTITITMERTRYVRRQKPARGLSGSDWASSESRDKSRKTLDSIEVTMINWRRPLSLPLYSNDLIDRHRKIFQALISRTIINQTQTTFCYHSPQKYSGKRIMRRSRTKLTSEKMYRRIGRPVHPLGQATLTK